MSKVLIIAEAGVNHNGSLELAKKLIDKAAEAGADIVKFQTFKAEKLVSRDAKKADYQMLNIGDDDDNQFQMLKKLELKEEWHNLLIEHCKMRNIAFLSTGFDEDSVDFLDRLGIDIYKIPSGEITNKPYIKHIAQKNKRVILSTGMSNMQEIKDAIEVLVNEGLAKDKISVLHCNTEYPTPMKDVNLKAMLFIGETLGTEVGYSDHTLGIEVPIAAAALGATIIEKHFTLDRTMPGPDHLASLEPAELKEMVRSIRNIELAISGNGLKEPSESEKKNIAIARKSIHLVREVNVGEILKADDFIMQRPGDGISPMQIDEVIGKKAIQTLQVGSKLTWEQIS